MNQFLKMSAGVLAVLAIAISGTVRAEQAQGNNYKHGEDETVLLSQLPKTKHSLADGIRQVSKAPETAISAKFELKDGKLMLSVYTAEKGLDKDAEHNVLKEYIGSPETARWMPNIEVFEDVPHVSRSSQQLTLMALASTSLIDVVRGAAKEGTVFSITPMIEDGEGRFTVRVAKAGQVLTLEYDRAGRLVDKYEEKHGRTETQEHAGSAWYFDDVASGMLPPGWKAEGTNQRGSVATWIVKADGGAASKPNVLALTDTKQGAGSTFNLCWTNHVKLKDGVIEVKVKAGTGREDQGGGPIWRVQDNDNYYVARWNPLEDNFRLYYVKDGRRRMLDSAGVKADPAMWHTIRIEHRGDEIACYFDGEVLLEVRDKTFTGAGGVGLWTKADATTAFDDLEVKGEATRLD